MKAFFEEYGLTIVIVIVLAILIGVAVRSGRKGSNEMKKTYDNFTSKATNFVDEAMNENGDVTNP